MAYQARLFHLPPGPRTTSGLSLLSLSCLSFPSHQFIYLMAEILVGRGRYVEVDFPVVMEAAKAELVKFVGKGE